MDTSKYFQDWRQRQDHFCKLLWDRSNKHVILEKAESGGSGKTVTAFKAKLPK